MNVGSAVRSERAKQRPWVAVVCALMLMAGAAAVVAMVARSGRAIPSAANAAVTDRAELTGASTGQRATALIVEMGAEMAPALRASRAVMLGSRNPNGNSCVTPVQTGEVQGAMPTNQGDLDGGPGTRMATVYTLGRKNLAGALDDYAWHQDRMKKLMENQQTSNALAERAVVELSEHSQRLLEIVEGLEAWPEDLKGSGFAGQEEWPSYCLMSLEKAVAERDLKQLKHWALELRCAMFGLEDLHRWLGFLCENNLTALEFQKRCEELFRTTDLMVRPYIAESSISQYPAGVLTLNSFGNWYEVERQAERWFTMPKDRFDEITLNRNFTPATAWVNPNLRECFLKLQQSLTGKNRQTWELAARTPFDHGYLVSMLYRALRSGTVEDMAAVLKKFDATHPDAAVSQIMSVLMYRGHSFAGLEWADRYRPELMAAADEINKGSDLDVLMAASQYANKFNDERKDYGITLTLRQSMETKVFDCVRATDMIGALYRNAGRPSFGHVRWCAGNGAHSVAASAIMGDDGKRKVVMVDGMGSTERPEGWPEAYFNGHKWPRGMESNPQPYAVELYVRGIDNYIWAEGYIVRGENAGWLSKARVPYAPEREVKSTAKVYEGPYPQ